MLRSNNPSNIYCGPADQRYTEGDNCYNLMIRVPADVAPLITWGVGGQMALPYGWELDGKVLVTPVCCHLLLLLERSNTEESGVDYFNRRIQVLTAA